MKIESSKIINFFKYLPKKTATHSFSAFIVLFILALVGGGVVFYKYNIQKETLEVQYIEKRLRFQKDVYKRVLNYWQEVERNLANIESRQYDNPFLEEVSFIPTSTVPQEPTSTEEESSEEKSSGEPSVTCCVEIQKLLATKNLFEFYSIKGEKVPYLWQRAEMWEAKGLGSKDEYKGTKYQNALLLEKLKEELTQ